MYVFMYVCIHVSIYPSTYLAVLGYNKRPLFSSKAISCLFLISLFLSCRIANLPLSKSQFKKLSVCAEIIILSESPLCLIEQNTKRERQMSHLCSNKVGLSRGCCTSVEVASHQHVTLPPCVFPHL